jgi:hypothetical protein
MISGFQCGVHEVFAVLGCYTVWIGGWLAVFRDSLSFPFLDDGTDILP